MEVLLKEQMFVPHTRHPNAWIPYQRDEPVKCLALKTNRNYVQGKHRVVKNEDFTLKGFVCKSTHSRTG